MKSLFRLLHRQRSLGSLDTRNLSVAGAGQPKELLVRRRPGTPIYYSLES
jgi:hypothetical protein